MLPPRKPAQAPSAVGQKVIVIHDGDIFSSSMGDTQIAGCARADVDVLSVRYKFTWIGSLQLGKQLWRAVLRGVINDDDFKVLMGLRKDRSDRFRQQSPRGCAWQGQLKLPVFCELVIHNIQ